jgi:hypothetical protein
MGIQDGNSKSLQDMLVSILRRKLVVYPRQQNHLVRTSVISSLISQYKCSSLCKTFKLDSVRIQSCHDFRMST